MFDYLTLNWNLFPQSPEEIEQNGTRLNPRFVHQGETLDWRDKGLVASVGREVRQRKTRLQLFVNNNREEKQFSAVLILLKQTLLVFLACYYVLSS